MALETLRDITEIGGMRVGRVVGGPPTRNFIEINDEANSITFEIQDGPIGEVGVNGCQVDALVDAATAIIRGLNKKFPCRENSLAITKLEEAMMWLRERTRDREARGVEGTNQG